MSWISKTAGTRYSLWRGSLLPLGYEVALRRSSCSVSPYTVADFTAAAQASGTVRRSDKLPRKKSQLSENQ
jgi:hypothetical protein